jgi:small ubiquitin-related modifier
MSDDKKDIKTDAAEPITIRVREQVSALFQSNHQIIIIILLSLLHLFIKYSTNIRCIIKYVRVAKTGEETFFKIKTTTKMSKVFEAFAQRKGLQVGALRFLLDGVAIEADSTPKTLDLEDQDQIDCMLAQVGGGW